MSDTESQERTYTFFHEDGPITLTEHDLCNEYMRLRAIEDALPEKDLLKAVGAPWEFVQDDRDAKTGTARVLDRNNRLVFDGDPHDAAAAVDAINSSFPPTTFAWLVERGQPEGFDRPIWLTPGWVDWTTDANQARRFGTREEAEAFIERHAVAEPQRAHEFSTARAVEHGWVSNPANSPSYAGPDADGGEAAGQPGLTGQDPSSSSAQSPASKPEPCEPGQHVWKLTMGGDEYACVKCGAFSEDVQSPASDPLGHAKEVADARWAELQELRDASAPASEPKEDV